MLLPALAESIESTTRYHMTMTGLLEWHHMQDMPVPTEQLLAGSHLAAQRKPPPAQSCLSPCAAAPDPAIQQHTLQLAEICARRIMQVQTKVSTVQT